MMWLKKRPVAHRGLHDAKARIYENTLAAAKHAIDNGFAIECDVQVTRDGEAIVFHDDDIKRMTGESGLVQDVTLKKLQQLYIGDAPVPSLANLLNCVQGQMPLVVELKSHFDGDARLVNAVAKTVGAYSGLIAFQSFDPYLVEKIQQHGLHPCGFIGQSAYDDWRLDPDKKQDLKAFAMQGHFDFLVWKASDIPCSETIYARNRNIPVLAWTIRSKEEWSRISDHADQMIFEAMIPSP